MWNSRQGASSSEEKHTTVSESTPFVPPAPSASTSVPESNSQDISLGQLSGWTPMVISISPSAHWADRRLGTHRMSPKEKNKNEMRFIAFGFNSFAAG